jgi:hypothetical protein
MSDTERNKRGNTRSQFQQQDLGEAATPQVRENKALTFASQVAAHAQEVSLNHTRIEELAGLWGDATFSIPEWNWPVYLQTDDINERAAYDLVLHSQNACYWHPGLDQEGNEVRFYDGGREHGADLAALKISKSWSQISQPNFLANVTEDYVESELFGAQVKIPLVAQRTECLREVGKFLDDMRALEQSFTQLFQSLHNDAYLIAEFLQGRLPLWEDPFMKRAQLFPAMLYGRFQKHPECPINRDSLVNLTEFLDYRIPETLYAIGAIDYSKTLSERIRNREILQSDSREEGEIRAVSLVALKTLRDKLNEMRGHESQITALETDYLCWGALRTKDQAVLQRLIVRDKLPHPRCLTMRY